MKNLFLLLCSVTIVCLMSCSKSSTNAAPVHASPTDSNITPAKVVDTFSGLYVITLNDINGISTDSVVCTLYATHTAADTVVITGSEPYIENIDHGSSGNDLHVTYGMHDAYHLSQPDSCTYWGNGNGGYGTNHGGSLETYKFVNDSLNFSISQSNIGFCGSETRQFMGSKH